MLGGQRKDALLPGSARSGCGITRARCDLMNDEIRFANRIRQALNERTQLDARVAERLRAARELALAARKPEREPAFAWVRDASAALVGGFGGVGGFSLRLLLPMLLLAAGLVAIYTWQQDRRA